MSNGLRSGEREGQEICLHSPSQLFGIIATKRTRNVGGSNILYSYRIVFHAKYILVFRTESTFCPIRIQKACLETEIMHENV
jgi:hypothetical protein